MSKYLLVLLIHLRPVRLLIVWISKGLTQTTLNSKGWELSYPYNCIGSLLESLTQGLLVGKLLIGGLGVIMIVIIMIVMMIVIIVIVIILVVIILIYIYIYIYIHQLRPRREARRHGHHGDALRAVTSSNELLLLLLPLIIIMIIIIILITIIILILFIMIVTILLMVRLVTPGLHNKILAQKIFARGWVAQEPICS